MNLSRLTKNKRKKYWKKVKKKFEKDIRFLCCDNKVFCMLMIKTYIASRHRSHIMKIWYMSRNHRDFKAEYDIKLFGTHLTGEDSIMKTLYFANKEIYDKWNRKIPEVYAMAGAYNEAIKEMKRLTASQPHQPKPAP